LRWILSSRVRPLAEGALLRESRRSSLIIFILGFCEIRNIMYYD
jgi:hypothetical protein